jgi:type II secretory pathway pseudopilin PulG
MNPQNSAPQPSSGFSLIETLITASLIGLMLTLAVPKFGARINRLSLLSETNSLRLFIERFNAYALTSRLTINLAVTSLSITASHQNGEEIGRLDIKHDAHLEPLPGSAKAITLYPTISASPTTITITKGNDSCSVIISLRGRIRSVC